MLERPSKLTSYRFDQLADQINKRVMPAEADVERYVGLEHLDPDSLRIRRWGDTSEVESTKLLFQPGDIIFGKRRVYTRKVAVADFRGICSAHAMVLRAKPKYVIPDFLPFLMRSDLFMERALSISVGSLSPTINWTTLAKEKFFLPPLDKQAHLVSVLNASTNVEQSLRVAEYASRSLLEGAREALIPKPETAEYCIGDVARHRVSKVSIEGCQEFRLAGVYSFGRGLIDRGKSDASSTKYKYLHQLTEGAIVVSKLKAWEGAVAVAGPEFEGALASPEYPTFELDRSKILPAYMDQVCRSPWFWREILRRCKGTAERRARIHPNEFLKVPIPKLSLEHQELVVSRLCQCSASADSLGVRYEQAKQITNNLTQSIFLPERSGTSS